jgi:DNA mismatch repair protein MutS
MVQSPEFYKQYQDAYKKYTELYGKQVCVFLKKGSFYEFYGQETPSNTPLNTAKQVMEIFGIAIHVYPGEAPDGNTGFFGGVPEYTLDKWAAKLTIIGWTVIVIDEIKTGAKIKREVTKILSAGTHVDSADSNSSFYLSSLWLKASDFGVASTDLTTGQVHIYQGKIHGLHADDLRHFFQVYPPKELVVYLQPIDEDLLRRTLHLPSVPIHQRTFNDVFELSTARATYLRSIFQPKSALPLSVWLNTTTSEHAEKALCFLLRFAEDHAPNLATSLQPPRLWHPTEHVQIINNCLTQLNLVKSSEQLCVEDLFTPPVTVMGKRGLREYLCTPLTQVSLIKARQEKLRWLREQNQKEIHAALGLINDLPRLHRSIQGGKISAADVVSYAQSLQGAHYLCGLTTSSPFHENLEHQIQDALTAFTKVFDVEKAKHSSDSLGFLQETAGPHSREAEVKCQGIIDKANTWLKNLLKVCGVEEDSVYFKPTDKSMFLIHATKTSAKKIEAAVKLNQQTYKDLLIKPLTSSARIEHRVLDSLQAELDAAQSSLQRCLASEVPYACINYSETSETWRPIESWILTLDLSLSMARTAEKHGWIEPSIIDGHSSSISIENLRHPLIEVQKTQSKYVTHNVSLGGESKSGWLLYGMNASGKSSLMKAIGLATLLAQIGSYVPATKMTLTPFHKIATRILNQDNLWAGLSSFAVEMSELREIFQVADDRTLVLGDELCSGTESVSATAIVAAGIEWLHKASSKFVLATHLHDLTSLPSIISLPSLSIWHLHVEYNHARDILIYHRDLKPGPGSSMYGLEVARALHLPADMIESAFKIRRILTGETSIEDSKASQWNTNLIKNSCARCGSFINLHTHHIQERHETTSSRNKDGTALHGLRNLTVLCESCHNNHHSGEESIGSVIDTSEGPILETYTKRKSAMRLSPEELDVIREARAKSNNIPLKLLVFKLEKEHGITITEKQLKQLA